MLLPPQELSEGCGGRGQGKESTGTKDHAHGLKLQLPLSSTRCERVCDPRDLNTELDRDPWVFLVGMSSAAWKWAIPSAHWNTDLGLGSLFLGSLVREKMETRFLLGTIQAGLCLWGHEADVENQVKGCQ